MSIVDKVIERIERKRSREKPKGLLKREEEVWDMENWLVGTGRVGKKTRKAHL